MNTHTIGVAVTTDTISHSTVSLVIIRILCLLVLSAGPVLAQSVPSGAGVPAATTVLDDSVVTQEQLEAARKTAESDTSISETLRPKALDLYDQGIRWLIESANVKTELSRLETQVRNAPSRIEALRTELAEFSKADPLKDDKAADPTLDQLELRIIEASSILSQSKESLKTKKDLISGLLVGSKGLSEDIAARISALEKIDKDLATPVPDEPAAMNQARTLALKARRFLRQTELELLKLRLSSANTLTSLAQAERDLLEVEIARREPRLAAYKALAQQLLERRVRDARQEAEALESRSVGLPPLIQSIAQENASYRNELERLVEKENTVTGQLEKTRAGLQEIKTDFEHTRQRVDVVGSTEAIGKMLMRRRGNLPSAQSYHRTSAGRINEISRTTDRQIDIDELLRERNDIQAVLAGVNQGIPPDIQGEAREALQGEALQLARSRRESLRELQTVYGRYIGQLTSLDLADRQLVSVSRNFTDYIDDQLLWIPGRGIETMVGPAALGNALLWFLSPSNWLELVQDLWALLFGKLGFLLLVALLFLVLLMIRRRASRVLVDIAEDTGKIRTDSFLLTLKALGLTLVIVGALPFLMVSLGWLMSRVPTAGTFSLMMANGLTKAGWILFSLGFLRQICLPNGLGDSHLGWPKPIRESIAREIGWLLPLVVPLGFLVAASIGSAVPQSAQSFGQLAFIAVMFASAVFLYRLLGNQGKLMMTAREQEKPGVLVQLHFIWFPLFVLLPLALALTAALGYQYAAVNLQEQSEITFWFFVVLFLLKELLLRSLYVAERRLRLQDAVRRRDELRAQRERGEQHEDEAAPVISLDIPELNFDQLGDQAKRLIRAGYLFSAVIGTWFIWSDLLPALGFLNSTELPFQASRIIDGVAKDVQVTLGDLVAGLIIVVITMMAAKNLPGILEITLLQRLPLEPGARYAITSLSQYLIAGIGLVSAFSSIGLQWSSIQWLVAALSVGLGFGLQEIVANFISGIILLFERPIRVGDVVTVNNTTGKVTRIRIRATTITNWERQELLIPNKQFITSEVINWTLTDKVNRIMITVGVAYGSDVPKAMQLMLDAAKENPEVLGDPQPVASFEAFGDNALTLFLRAYLGIMDNRLATITALHQAINDKFKEAGIEISFPQRDVHFDAAQPLEIRVSRPPRGDGQEAPV